MKRALLIAWYFPPIGGPGVQRTAKYCKYLARLGWNITVIAGVDPDEHQDNGFLVDIPDGTEVHRLPRPLTAWRKLRQWMFTKRIGPIGLGRLAHWIGFLKDFPDTQAEWGTQVVLLAKRLHHVSPFDVLYTSSYPYSVHTAGDAIKRATGLPWVADLRDPWAENDIMLGHLPQWMRRRHRRHEAAMATMADRITFAHPGHAQRFADEHAAAIDKCVPITNGFDKEDYKGFPDAPACADGVVRLVHTGSFYGAYAPTALERALHEYWSPLPEPATQLEVRFIGGDGGTVFPKRHGLRVVTRPRVLHSEALKEQAEAHLLLCVFDRTTGPTNVSGKLFEYLATGRPIVGILPEDGTMADIIRQTGAGWVADCDRPDDIVKLIHHAMHQIATGASDLKRNEAAIREYARDVLAQRLAEVFSGAIDMSPRARHDGATS